MVPWSAHNWRSSQILSLDSPTVHQTTLEDIKERLELIQWYDELRGQLAEQENVTTFTHKRVAF